MSRSLNWQSLLKETPQDTPVFQSHSSYVSEAESEHSSLPLFNGIQYHEELEKPIKVEAPRRFESKTKQIEKNSFKSGKKFKRNRAYEENEVKEMNVSRELFKSENELQAVQQSSKMGHGDGQLMRMNGDQSSYAHYQDLALMDEIEANNVSATQRDAMIQQPELIHDHIGQDYRNEQKRRVYLLANSFNQFYQATKIFSASIKLAKRDSVNKVYQSMLNVVLKQSSKMEVQIEKEFQRVMNLPQPSPAHESLLYEKTQPFDFNKQLVITGAQMHDDMRMPLEMERAPVQQEDQ